LASARTLPAWRPRRRRRLSPTAAWTWWRQGRRFTGSIARARVEFSRILKPGGWVALLWNYRRLDTTAFLRGYEALLRKYCPDYAGILDRDLHRRQVEEFFDGKVSLATFDNPQEFDWSGLEGRHLSQSYVPLDGPRFAPMMRALRELFDATQLDGRVVFEHETRVYLGRP
jgi:SAM-dependent methyltransferase